METSVDPEIIRALTIIAVTIVVVFGLVAILAPAALGALVRPLLEVISKLVDALTHKTTPE